MATGFEKFKNKALSEQPINISKAPEAEPVRERRAMPIEQAPAAAPLRAARAERVGESGKQPENITICVQISNEAKGKLDEMKFRMNRKIREIVEEAIDDVYNKYYR